MTVGAGTSIGSPERRESGLAVRVDIDVEMAYGSDAFLGAFPAAWAKWIGGYIDVRAVSVLVGEPSKIARRKCLSPGARSVA